MKKNIKGLFFVFLSTLVLSVGQIFFKFASTTFEFKILSLITNFNLWLGFIFYGLGFLILIFGLKDGELSVLYPALALSYVWVLILSKLIFNEIIGLTSILGTLSIILGVSIIAKYSYQMDIKKLRKWTK